jgi:(hydroxyamino)benzene mutase
MRHPDDPEPVADSKATAAYGLGVLAVVTGLAVGGVVPATIALLLARQAQDDLATGAGWRTGAGRIRLARRLAWIGIAMAVVTLVTVATLVLLQGAGPGDRDFPPSVD